MESDITTGWTKTGPHSLVINCMYSLTSIPSQSSTYCVEWREEHRAQI
jgi:hypothetical protein